jgi:chitinase
MRLRRVAAAALGVLAGIGALTPAAGAAAGAVSIGDASILEGDAGVRRVAFAVTLSTPATQTVTVDWELAAAGASPATADTDYRDASGTVTFRLLPSGLTTTWQRVLVAITPDVVAEGDETFEVRLANPSGGVALARSTAVGTILDDDTIPHSPSDVLAAVGDVSIGEGDVGPRAVRFSLALSRTSPAPVTLGVAVSSGTATCGPGHMARPLSSSTDCANLGGTTRYFRYPILPSMRSVVQYVTVPVYPETAPEDDEQFTVVVSAVEGAVTVVRSTGTGTILDDD